MYLGYSKETEFKLQQRHNGLRKIRSAAGTLLATFNKHKQHLSVDEKIRYNSSCIPELGHLDQAIEDTEMALDTL